MGFFIFLLFLVIAVRGGSSDPRHHPEHHDPSNPTHKTDGHEHHHPAHTAAEKECLMRCPPSRSQAMCLEKCIEIIKQRGTTSYLREIQRRVFREGMTDQERQEALDAHKLAPNVYHLRAGSVAAARNTLMKRAPPTRHGGSNRLARTPLKKRNPHPKKK